MNNDNLFMKYLYEAPEDEAPDMGDTGDIGESDPPADNAPDMGDDDFGGDSEDSPPDMDGGMDDSAPDMGGGFDDAGDDSFGDDNQDDDSDNNKNNKDSFHLDDKVSNIMNMNLYQRYLSLLSKIKEQLSMIKENNDIIRSISPESLDMVDSLKKLEENINLYIKNNFMNENYSKNLLFFNKCLNLLKLLNDVFDKKIHAGIKKDT
jgi:hypothetical protein